MSVPSLVVSQTLCCSRRDSPARGSLGAPCCSRYIVEINYTFCSSRSWHHHFPCHLLHDLLSDWACDDCCCHFCRSVERLDCCPACHFGSSCDDGFGYLRISGHALLHFHWCIDIFAQPTAKTASDTATTKCATTFYWIGHRLSAALRREAGRGAVPRRITLSLAAESPS